jgi:DNA-binding transcriptional LysR family regulator
MEIGQLEAFVAVAREGSFTRAADILNISQPSLSARIRQLEYSLNGQLIDRKSRPVSLTPAGKVFCTYAERALDILFAAQESVRSANQDLIEEIVIGCPFSVATYLIPEVVGQFSQIFPDAELSIDTGNSEYVVSRLEDGLINLAIAAAFPKFLTANQTLLRLHDQMTVAISDNHPLNENMVVYLADLWKYRVLLIHWGPAFQAYMESMRQLVHHPGALIRLPLAGALPMAHQPDTITFMPRRLVASSGLTELQVFDLSYAWDIALLTRQGREITALEKAFVKILEDVWQHSTPVL